MIERHPRDFYVLPILSWQFSCLEFVQRIPLVYYMLAMCAYLDNSVERFTFHA